MLPSYLAHRLNGGASPQLPTDQRLEAVMRRRIRSELTVH